MSKRRKVAVLLAWGITTLFLALLAIRAELDGGYTLETMRGWRRDIADMRLAASLASVPCPKSAFVIAALGQSNAGNHVGSRVPADPSLPAFAFFRDRCVPLSDPVPGATGTEGSLWTALAHRLVRERGEPVVVIAGAAATSSVAHWLSDFGGIASRATRSISGASENGLSPHVAIWLQGEADALAGTPRDAYEASLERLLKRIAMEPGPGSPNNPLARPPVWIITQTSRCGDSHAGDEGVRAAQRAVASRLPAAQAGPDTDSLGTESRSDGCHLNDAGRSRIVDALLWQLMAIKR